MVAAAAIGYGLGCALTFPCTSSDQCTRDGIAGTCQGTGYCSFPDAGCESEQRYGELAPADLAGTCVLGDGETDPGATTGSPTPGSGTLGLPTTSGASDSSAGVVDTGSGGQDSSSSGGQDSSSGGEVNCCDATCPGSCQGNCVATLVGGPVPNEAISVAVSGDWVVWSTGGGRTLEMVSLDGTMQQQLLSTVVDNDFVTRIAANQDYVWFLDHGGGTLRRASVPVHQGPPDLVTTIQDSQALFGGLAVSQDHVYFVMQGAGQIFRVPIDAVDTTPQLVASGFVGRDVAIDDTHVYWSDSGAETILRLAFAGIDSMEAPTQVVTSLFSHTLAVDDTHIFYSTFGQVLRADKDGFNQGVTVLAAAQGDIREVAIDDLHLYWTAPQNSRLVRTAKDGRGPVEELATTMNPWGVALTCNAVFWTEQGNNLLYRILK